MRKDSPTRPRVLSAADLEDIKHRRVLARERLKSAAHDEDEPGAIDPDNPPLTDEQLERLQPAHEVRPRLVAERLKRERGRPPSANRKELISIRLDPDVIARLRATGEGWQSRINDTLRKSLGLPDADRMK